MADDQTSLPDTADDTGESWWSYARRIGKTILEVTKELKALRQENKKLQEQVLTLSEKLAHQAGHLASLDKFIETKVELEVRKRLDEAQRRN